MILARCSSAKTFSFVGKQAGASIPTCSTENGGAKFRKKEWQRIGDEIKVAFVFTRVKPKLQPASLRLSAIGSPVPHRWLSQEV
jgi:hypothetical protein